MTSFSNILPEVENDDLKEINKIDQQLYNYFQNKFVVQPLLTRILVSFQGNKTRPIYRWYKYKEAFSASLVELLCQKYKIIQGKLLDPFAGSGTALFAASNIGIDADGIELLPIGQQIIKTKRLLDVEFTTNDFERLKTWSELEIWQQFEGKMNLP